MDHAFAERRIATRIDLSREIAVVVEGEAQPALTVNVSTSGLLVRLSRALTIWAEVEVLLPGPVVRGARIVRRDDDRYGLVFREPLSAQEFADFTGTELAPAPAEPAPTRRIAATAFGRDKVKTFLRLAADRARVSKAQG